MSTPEGSESNVQPERAFNFGAMSDHQVMYLGRSVLLGIDHEVSEHRIVGIDGLLDLYLDEMATLLERDPDRVKHILKEQVLSKDRWDEVAALEFTPSVARRDFDLARDIVAFSAGRSAVAAPSILADEAELARRVAELEIRRDVATTEQTAALDAAISAAVRSRGRRRPPGLVS